jgi:hypothetical protein
MRLLFVVVGIIVLLMGSVWAFQGAGVIPGSFMTGDPTWIAIGAPTAAAGAILTVLGLRAKRPSVPPSLP